MVIVAGGTVIDEDLKSSGGPDQRSLRPGTDTSTIIEFIRAEVASRR